QLLADSALVITQAGYNTALDVATGGLRAVFIPAYDGNGTDREMNEQVRRARVMSRLTGAAVLLQEDAEDSAQLQSAVKKAADSHPAPIALPLDGAEKFADVVCRINEGRRARARARSRQPESETRSTFKPHELR